MKAIQSGTLFMLSSAIMASAAPVVSSNANDAGVLAHVKRDWRTDSFKQFSKVHDSDQMMRHYGKVYDQDQLMKEIMVKYIMDKEAALTKMPEKKKSDHFTTEQAMTYAATILGLAVLPLYAYGRYTNSLAISNYDELKTRQKVLAAKAQAQQEAAQKMGGRKPAGGLDVSSGGGATFGRDVNDEMPLLYTRDDTGNGGSGNGNSNNNEEHPSRGGHAEDDYRLFKNKFHQFNQETAQYKQRKAELKAEFHKTFGYSPKKPKYDFSDVYSELSKGAAKVEEVVPKHPNLDKKLAAVGLGAAILGIWMGYDSAWKGKHYYDGSVEALQDVKQKMPVGWSKRDVNDETAATSPVFIGADGKARPIVLVSREAN